MNPALEEALKIGMPLVLLMGLPVVTMAAAGETSELGALRERFVSFILPADPAAGKPIIDIAARWTQSQKEDGSWPDLDYADQDRAFWKAEQHLERTLQMAKAVRLKNPPDPALESATLKALSWWLEHDLKNSNWWFNEIGIPQLLGEVGALMGDRIPPESRAKMVEIMKRGVWTKWTGQNLVWGTGNQVLRGLLEDSPQTVADAYTRMYEEIRVEPLGKEGIQQDFSFHQHGSQLYSGGYGLGFANDVTRFVALSWGTRYQAPDEKIKILESYLLDGEQWMIRGLVFDYSAVGRELTRAGKRAVIRDWDRGPISPAGAAYGLENGMTVLSKLTTPRQSEIADFAATLRGEPDAKPLSGNRYFWCSDYMTHHRKDFFISIRMFSDRLINTELVNNEGKRSHHLADGAMYIYRAGGEYHDIFPAWDWTKIPGTTAVQTPVEQLDLKQYVRVKGATSFVGGVSDGQVGLAVMDLKRESLSAKKAWLCLDDAVVCLGAGISCADGQTDVVTTVNQCLREGDVVQSPDRKSIRHGGIQYLFDEASNVKLSSGAQGGRWSDIGAGSNAMVTKDVVLLYIDHGRAPKDAAYQYTIAFAQPPKVEVLANSPRLQAVRGEDVLGVVFWEAGRINAGGSVGEIEADQPCLVLIRKPGDQRQHVAVSNPRQQPMRINLRIGGQLHSVDTKDGSSFLIE